MKLSNRTSTDYGTRRSPEQEESDRLAHEAIKALQSPIAYGSPKQIAWANSIFETERFYWYAQGYAIADLKLFLNSQEARSAKWWIDNRPTVAGCGKCRIAMEQAIAAVKRSQSMSEERFKKLVKRL